MKTTLIIGVLLASTISTKLFGQDMHKHQPDLSASTRMTILKQVLDEKTNKNGEVEMIVVDYPPNSGTPAHRHPGPTFGYVLEGEIESVFEGKTYVYKKGDSFYEKSNGLHFSATNKSATLPAKLLVFFITEKGKPTTVLENED